MIPALVEIEGAPEEIRYLPVGIHKTTLNEIETNYAYNIFRKEIFEGLLRLITELKKIGCNTIYVNGSFATSIAIPKDVDVCWVESSGTNYNYERINLPVLWNRQETQRLFKADVFPANVTESRSGLSFLEFFQRIKYTELKKGILQLDIY